MASTQECKPSQKVSYSFHTIILCINFTCTVILCCCILYKESFLSFSQERDDLMELLAKKTAEKEKMAIELQAYRENDPEVIEGMKQEILTAHEAANRWTGRLSLL